MCRAVGVRCGRLGARIREEGLGLGWRGLELVQALDALRMRSVGVRVGFGMEMSRRGGAWGLVALFEFCWVLLRWRRGPVFFSLCFSKSVPGSFVIVGLLWRFCEMKKGRQF